MLNITIKELEANLNKEAAIINFCDIQINFYYPLCIDGLNVKIYLIFFF